MTNTYTIRLGGTSFSINTDEEERYIRTLEKNVEEMLERAQLSGASGNKAALFVCMELADMLEKEREKEIEKDKSSLGDKNKKSCAEVLFPDKEQTSLFQKNKTK